MKKEPFVNRRRHFVTVCLRFCCQFSDKFFFYRAVNSDKPIFVSFLVFFGVAASVTAKISSFETVAKREAILNPIAKQ